jgi:hypothetical protein
MNYTKVNDLMTRLTVLSRMKGKLAQKHAAKTKFEMNNIIKSQQTVRVRAKYLHN